MTRPFALVILLLAVLGALWLAQPTMFERMCPMWTCIDRPYP